MIVLVLGDFLMNSGNVCRWMYEEVVCLPGGQFWWL